MKGFHRNSLCFCFTNGAFCPFCSSTASRSLHVKEHTLQNQQAEDAGASRGHHNAGHDHISTAKAQRVSVFVPAASHARLLPRFTSVTLFSSLFSADIWESHWLACEQRLRLHNVSHPHRLHTMSLSLSLLLTRYYQTLFTSPPETEAPARDNKIIHIEIRK